MAPGRLCPLKKNRCMISLIIRSKDILTDSQLVFCWHHLHSVIIILACLVKSCCDHDDWLAAHCRDWVTHNIIDFDLKDTAVSWVPLKRKYSCSWEMTHCVSGVAVSSKRNVYFIFIRTNWDVYSISWKNKVRVIRLSLLTTNCPSH